MHEGHSEDRIKDRQGWSGKGGTGRHGVKSRVDGWECGIGGGEECVVIRQLENGGMQAQRTAKTGGDEGNAVL